MRCVQFPHSIFDTEFVFVCMCISQCVHTCCRCECAAEHRSICIGMHWKRHHPPIDGSLRVFFFVCFGFINFCFSSLFGHATYAVCFSLPFAANANEL